MMIAVFASPFLRDTEQNESGPGTLLSQQASRGKVSRLSAPQLGAAFADDAGHACHAAEARVYGDGGWWRELVRSQPAAPSPLQVHVRRLMPCQSFAFVS